MASPWFMAPTKLLRITEYLAEAGRIALDLLYPPACAACRQPLSAGHPIGLCDPCRSQFLCPLPTCPRCGLRLGPFVPVAKSCAGCRRQSQPYQRVVSVGRYDGLLREAVIAAKELPGEPLAVALARLLAQRLCEQSPPTSQTVVIPIPSQSWRRLRRGTSAAETLAIELARQFQLPLLMPLYCRRRVAKQGTLSLSQRAENVRDLFAIRQSVAQRWQAIPRAHREALLIDDVMTSGSTVREAARQLRRSGLSRITVAVLARAQ